MPSRALLFSVKKIFYLLILLSWTHLAAAQHTELLGRAGLNFSRFVGSSVENTSNINMYSFNGANYGYTNNPYGSHLGLGAGLGVRLLHESRFPLLFALDLGFDYQRARTDIARVGYYDDQAQAYRSFAADGHSYFKSKHADLFAALGYRLRLGEYHLDLLAGPELAAVFGRREAGQGTYNNTQNWLTDVDRGGGVPFDALLRADLTVWRGRAGLNASYAWGSVNYMGGLVGGGPHEAYDRSLRLGLVYRLSPGGAH